MLVGDVAPVLAGERQPACEHLEEHDTGRVQVAPRVNGPSGEHLWGDVFGGAEEVVRDGRCGETAGEAEVPDLDTTVVREQHVGWLDVPVDDPAGMRGRE